MYNVVAIFSQAFLEIILKQFASFKRSYFHDASCNPNVIYIKLKLFLSFISLCCC